MTKVICDWECTCWDKNTDRRREIIEIASVKCNDKWEIIDEFSEFVCPIICTEISPFCEKLTTITQNDVDKAGIFPEVLGRFKKWLDKSENNIFHSWGYFDKKQLQEDCDLHVVKFPFDNRHINLKNEIAKELGGIKERGMVQVLKYLKMPLIGTQHRGIDDCRNIAYICQKVFNKKQGEING